MQQPKYIALSLLGLIVGLTLVASVTLSTNHPDKEDQDKIYVLPLVEEMPTANPLQF